MNVVIQQILTHPSVLKMSVHFACRQAFKWKTHDNTEKAEGQIYMKR